MKKFLLLLGFVGGMQAHEDDIDPHTVIEIFFNIVINSMNLALAPKGDKKAQLNACTQIMNSICNICLLTTKPPRKGLMTTAEFRNNMLATLQEMHIPELLAEECQQKRHIFISLLEESEQIAQPS